MGTNNYSFLGYFAMMFILSAVAIPGGLDPKVSKKFQEKFIIKGKWVRKFLIFKSKEEEPVLLYDFIQYIVHGIHLLILLPVHIIYWLTDNNFLGVILKGKPYCIYTLVVFLGVDLVWFVLKFIGRILRDKEERRKSKEIRKRQKEIREKDRQEELLKK